MSLDRRHFMAAGLTLGAAVTGTRLLLGDRAEAFVCPPCGCSMDDRHFPAPGSCPDCAMTLMPVQEHDLGLAPDALRRGAGRYRLRGGASHPHASFEVRYYLPTPFDREAPVLLVLPGSGRNADAYRNVWMTHARRCGQLVASLAYAQDDYDFAAYHMGGLVKDLRFHKVERHQDGAGQVLRAADEDIAFTPNPNPSQWLFPDFERVFEHLVAATGSRAPHFDVFGHSAGAQIAHRLVLCWPQASMGKVIAANAGFYTLPSLQESLPTGLRGAGVTRAALRQSLAHDLVILLGERDDGDSAGGTLLHTPRLDAQGLGRRQRGRTFYARGRALAEREQTPLAWQLREVPNVGHDFRAMSAAASELFATRCAGA